jgi:hypothetical protein
MKKIPLLFLRNPDNPDEMTKTPNPVCDWVFNGEGAATRKYDGSCCMIDEDGVFWKRRMVRDGKKEPDTFVLADVDPITKKKFGWVKVDSESPENSWHMEALKERQRVEKLLEGAEYEFYCSLGGQAATYELVGPKIQGNPEHYDKHVLIPHKRAHQYDLPDRSYEGIKEFFKEKDIEGLVFHHEDGRMAKIRKGDYGMKRGD